MLAVEVPLPNKRRARPKDEQNNVNAAVIRLLNLPRSELTGLLFLFLIITPWSRHPCIAVLCRDKQLSRGVRSADTLVALVLNSPLSARLRISGGTVFIIDME